MAHSLAFNTASLFCDRAARLTFTNEIIIKLSNRSSYYHYDDIIIKMIHEMDNDKINDNEICIGITF